MLVQLLTTTTGSGGLLDSGWFRSADLEPGQGITSLWLLIILFIIVLVLSPKIKGLKERIRAINIKAVFLWMAVIGLLAGLFYYFDGISYIQAYLN